MNKTNHTKTQCLAFSAFQVCIPWNQTKRKCFLYVITSITEIDWYIGEIISTTVFEEGRFVFQRKSDNSLSLTSSVAEICEKDFSQDECHWATLCTSKRAREKKPRFQKKIIKSFHKSNYYRCATFDSFRVSSFCFEEPYAMLNSPVIFFR